jgi:predicted DNA-binding protein
MKSKRTVITSIRIPEELRDSLREIAGQQDRTVNYIIRKLLEKGVKEIKNG